MPCCSRSACLCIVLVIFSSPGIPTSSSLLDLRHLAKTSAGGAANNGKGSRYCRYQQKLQQPTRQMPPLPAFLSNLTAQQPAAPNSYAIAGSPAQYLQPRQPQGAITTPQLPVMTGESALYLINSYNCYALLWHMNL